MKKILIVDVTAPRRFLILDSLPRDRRAPDSIGGSRCCDITTLRGAKRRSNPPRHELLSGLVKFLQSNHLDLAKLEGIALIEGHGSFSEARQAVAILNAICLIKKIPALGVDKRKYRGNYQKMFEDIIKYFRRPKRGSIIKPIYSGEPNITKPICPTIFATACSK